MTRLFVSLSLCLLLGLTASCSDAAHADGVYAETHAATEFVWHDVTSATESDGFISLGADGGKGFVPVRAPAGARLISAEVYILSTDTIEAGAYVKSRDVTTGPDDAEPEETIGAFFEQLPTGYVPMQIVLEHVTDEDHAYLIEVWCTTACTVGGARVTYQENAK